LKITINNAVHIGKKDPSKTRLLKLTLSSIDEKSAILRNNFKLRNSAINSSTRQVLYTPDFIPLEQKKNKELHMKLSDIDNFLQDNEWIDSTMEQLNCDNQTPYK